MQNQCVLCAAQIKVLYVHVHVHKFLYGVLKHRQLGLPQNILQLISWSVVSMSTL